MKKNLGSLLLIALTFLVFANHVGTSIPPISNPERESQIPGSYIEKTEKSHRHIFLSGPNYNRGFEFGRYTKNILLMEEELMVSKLDLFIGNKFIQKAFFTAMMLWFHDVDQYIDRGSLEEMQGVAFWAPKQFQNLATTFTRQIAYHGVHEVGQMFIDEDRVDMGCFVSAVQSPDKHWVVGRNFDFDIDGLFDREKILKWVYPESGHAYLSIIWPGMVGAVTGVNDDGLYVSLNAAGSDDYRRVGTPTTIVVKNILQEANSLEDAIEYIKKSQVFITEIFVLADKKTNRMAFVEKSSAKMNVKYLTKAEVVANHLEGEVWKNDETNDIRKFELTSDWRVKRGQELIKEGIYKDPVAQTAKILRDKSLYGNLKTHPGNRGAIDSFIASQSIIYDLEKGILYINLGPGTTGEFLGYDIAKTLKERTPVVVATLPSEGMNLPEYDSWQNLMQQVALAKKELSQNNCDRVSERLTILEREKFVHYDKSRLEGDYTLKCLKDEKKAREFWRIALDYNPPFARQRKYLEKKLEEKLK